jgi:hypothetical protein
MSDKSTEMLKEFVRQTREEMVAERLKRVSIKEWLAGLPAEEIFSALSPEMRAALAQRLKADGLSSKPQHENL